MSISQMTDQLVIDPWKEINRERQHLHLALKFLKQYVDRAEMSTASGTVSKEFCHLCAKVPAGMHPGPYRDACPCKKVPAFLKEESARLRVPIRRNKSETPEPLPVYDELTA